MSLKHVLAMAPAALMGACDGMQFSLPDTKESPVVALYDAGCAPEGLAMVDHRVKETLDGIRARAVEAAADAEPSVTPYLSAQSETESRSFYGEAGANYIDGYTVPAMLSFKSEGEKVVRFGCFPDRILETKETNPSAATDDDPFAGSFTGYCTEESIDTGIDTGESEEVSCGQYSIIWRSATGKEGTEIPRQEGIAMLSLDGGDSWTDLNPDYILNLNQALDDSLKVIQSVIDDD